MNSYFDGNTFELIMYKILTFLVTLFSFGILYPFAICTLYRWETSHTVIDGRRLRFDGTAMGLFGLWIKWLFFIFITLGIYNFFVYVDMVKWKTKNTHFE